MNVFERLTIKLAESFVDDFVSGTRQAELRALLEAAREQAPQPGAPRFAPAGDPESAAGDWVSADAVLAYAARLQAALLSSGIRLEDGPALAVAREMLRPVATATAAAPTAPAADTAPDQEAIEIAAGLRSADPYQRRMASAQCIAFVRRKAGVA